MRTIITALLLFIASFSQAQILKDTTIAIPIYNIEVRMAVAENIPLLYRGAPEQLCAMTYIEDDVVHMIFELSRIESDVIFHEVLHAVNFICIARGLQHDPENDEAQAYLAGYIGANLITFFRK